MDIMELLKQFSEAPGPSGYEQPVAAVVQDAWEPYTDTLRVDRVGSVIGVKHGRGPEPRRRLLLAAHIDEIGLMVKQIVTHNGNGFLRLTKVAVLTFVIYMGKRLLFMASAILLASLVRCQVVCCPKQNIISHLALKIYWLTSACRKPR